MCNQSKRKDRYVQSIKKERQICAINQKGEIDMCNQSKRKDGVDEYMYIDGARTMD